MRGDFLGYSIEFWMQRELFSLINLDKNEQVAQLEKECEVRKKKYFQYLVIPNIFVLIAIVVLSISVFLGEDSSVGYLAETIALFSMVVALPLTVISTYKYMKWDGIEDSRHETGNKIYESTYNPLTDSIQTKERKEYAGGGECFRIGLAIFFLGVVWYIKKIYSDKVSYNNAKKYLKVE